jgi:hypothetical protein
LIALSALIERRRPDRVVRVFPGLVGAEAPVSTTVAAPCASAALSVVDR